ncbi:thermonuclease family protein [Agrobacterium tumefaciens]|uniref:thermonuclease family protein n=1 Tax=Agrobacterium tumefaciens TaxID=358 RepID=UPI001571E46A|nr:thermonuclease family protein [Agrobacterium tumefaciens]NTD85679.1 thermonuclease family protein [Agrobacterium tumefaciens]NTD91028.1 thermonuclease family protein [Agrobacterium tumefaciens]NTE03852.1 thermonuclease family protein [Agrobacterium tumefaciens]NTE16102.1 thermonuclease family protein [Agrobacterium tumefaciens]NTE26678.1 thermonuclease family protein [Agrobacterium tumefaciens]
MSKVVRLESRRKAQPVSEGSFAKLVAFSMLASFVVGAGASYFLMGENAVPAQASVPKERSVSIIRGDEQTATAIATYNYCAGSVRVNCVVDGDTIWSNGVKIRVADIDTPEIGTPRCAAEKALGDRATKRLLELVNAGPFEMQSWPGRDEDKYGRKLRVLIRDGRSLGDILVSEGLARTWTGRRQPWC